MFPQLVTPIIAENVHRYKGKYSKNTTFPFGQCCQLKAEGHRFIQSAIAFPAHGNVVNLRGKKIEKVGGYGF